MSLEERGSAGQPHQEGVEPCERGPVLTVRAAGRLQTQRCRDALGSCFFGHGAPSTQRVLCTNLRKIKGSGLHCTVREDEISFPQLERLDTF